VSRSQSSDLWSLPPACERTAQYVSLELDGELSLGERAMLDHHLRRCERCEQYANDVAGLTGLLRTAPLEEFRLPTTLVGPRRRVVSPLVRSVAAVAAVATVGVWLGISSLGLTRRDAPFQTFNPTPITVADDSRDWAAGLPRGQHVVQLAPGGLSTSGITP
jgi:Putative zinc-finger